MSSLIPEKTTVKGEVGIRFLQVSLLLMVKTNEKELTVLTQLFMDCMVVLVMLSLR